MNYYKVTCLDAKYDEEAKMLVMNCRFEETQERKIVFFHKNDLPPFFRVNNMTSEQMNYFARCMKKRGRPFNLAIQDDPNRVKLSPEEEMQYAAMFNKRIADELEKVMEGLADDRGQIQRKLGRLVDEGKLNPVELLKEEKVVRGKLGA